MYMCSRCCYSCCREVQWRRGRKDKGRTRPGWQRGDTESKIWPSGCRSPNITIQYIQKKRQTLRCNSIDILLCWDIFGTIQSRWRSVYLLAKGRLSNTLNMSGVRNTTTRKTPCKRYYSSFSFIYRCIWLYIYILRGYKSYFLIVTDLPPFLKHR